MNFMMIFHAKLYNPKHARPQYFRCGCGRILFKANNESITVSNDIGMGWETHNPSQHWLELKCHSCKNNFKILFQ